MRRDYLHRPTIINSDQGWNPALMQVEFLKTFVFSRQHIKKFWYNRLTDVDKIICKLLNVNFSNKNFSPKEQTDE